MLLLLIAAALAGSYSADDVIIAAQRGLPPDAVASMLGAVDAVTSDDAVRFLRAGVPPEALAAATSGAHPTDQEVASARELGALPTLAPPRAYRTLGDASWMRLVGVDLIVTTHPAGDELAGRLLQVDASRVVLAPLGGAPVEVPRSDIATVRRADGGAILTETTEVSEPTEVEETTIRLPDRPADPRARNLRGAGGGLIVAGGLSGVVGLAGCFTAARITADATTGGPTTGLNSSAALCQIGLVGSSLAAPGAVLLGVGRGMERGAPPMERLPPSLDDLPED